MTIESIKTPEGIEIRAKSLNAAYQNYETQELLAAMINVEFAGKIALASSFGAESAVLLHMAANISPDLPVLFLNTGQLFEQTKQYCHDLTKLLALKNVQFVEPDQDDLRRLDLNNDLWQSDPDSCCNIRKTLPLASILSQFDAWITGRKRFQNNIRAELELIEGDDKHIKINPLLSWSQAQLNDYMMKNNLPPHPLVREGYLSIGCRPCTVKVSAGEDARAGRWAMSEKTECGIHNRNKA